MTYVCQECGRNLPEARPDFYTAVEIHELRHAVEKLTKKEAPA